MITLKTDEQSKRNNMIYTKKRIVQGMLLQPCNSRIIDFTIIPMIVSLILSFTDYNVIGDFKFTGIDNYRTIFMDDLFSKIGGCDIHLCFWQYAK